jgi:hypothetical protein
MSKCNKWIYYVYAQIQGYPMVYSDVTIESDNISNLQKLIGAIVNFSHAYTGVK